jgi:short subunit dehydrogenase-like uncharacterized protein
LLLPYDGSARDARDSPAACYQLVPVQRGHYDEVVDGDRDLDIALFGATGFVGRLVAEYLAAHAPRGLRIGLAGRSAERVTALRESLGEPAADWPVHAADLSDAQALTALARSARVVVSTAGPYHHQGLPLVEACARAGTDYADLTGEVLFIRDSIDHCHPLAVETGARIVHSCGFDSIPSDLGVLLLHDAARSDDSGELTDTTLVVRSIRGGISGGTIASAVGQLDDMRANVGDRRKVADPYTLSPDRAAEPKVAPARDLEAVRFDSGVGMWTGPFVFAGINTRVVRRSNALQDWAYGRRFRYREVMGFGTGPGAPVVAVAVSGAMLGLMAVAGFRPVRQFLPSPGSGPSEKTRRSGRFRIETRAITSQGMRYVCTIAADGDPGYAATSLMLGESALCLALDRERLPDRAGVLTPATALGTVLADRLRAAGQTLTVRRV